MATDDNTPIKIGFNPLTSKATPKFLACQTVEVSPGKKGETGAFRNALCAEELPTRVPAYPDAATVEEVFATSFERYKDRDFLGKRDVDSEGKAGPFQFLKYKEVDKLRRALGAGLQSLGLSKKASIGLFSKNRIEWLLADFACALHGYVSVPLYASIGPDAIKHVVQHSDVEVVVGTVDTLEQVESTCDPKECPHLKHLVVMDCDLFQQFMSLHDFEPEQAASTESKDANDTNGGTVWKWLSFAELIRTGMSHPVTPEAPQPDDLYTLVYTSGSTGVPKGVMSTHGGTVCRLAGVDMSDVSSHESHGLEPAVYPSYLPLAHIVERNSIQGIILGGGSVGFWQGDIKRLLDDIKALRPTIMTGAPRVYQRIRDAILGKVERGSWLSRTLFHWAYEAKRTAVLNNSDTPWWNKLVFNKISAALGGRCNRMITAGAAMDSRLMEFLAVCFNIPIIDAYGATETNGGGYISMMADWQQPGGCPNIGAEFKLIDVPELNYFASDKPLPRGELCIRSPSLMVGYYKDEQKTKETIDEDGYIHTGDVAQRNASGSFTIIDRTKSFFKLMQGEYIASEYLEAIYSRSPFVTSMLIMGNAATRYPVAVVVPTEENLQRKLGTKDSLAVLATKPEVKSLILESMVEQANQESLKPFEIVKAIHIEPTLWTSEGGELTPTFKLRRGVLRQRYVDIEKKLIEEVQE